MNNASTVAKYCALWYWLEWGIYFFKYTHRVTDYSWSSVCTDHTKKEKKMESYIGFPVVDKHK